MKENTFWEVMYLKKALFLAPLALAVSLGFSGLMAPTALANSPVEQTSTMQSHSLIEHVKLIRVDATSVTLFETWHNPITGDQRNDQYFQDKETISAESMVYHYTPNESLFEKMIKGYQDASVWKEIGFENYGGKQVKKLKTIVEPKGGIYQIAYIDTSTGLPLKEENYNNKNERIVTFAYFFNHVHDQSGNIFKIEERDVEFNTIKTK